MTTTQTIDGVLISRQLAERLTEGWNGTDARIELRSLLDAPAENVQWVSVEAFNRVSTELEELKAAQPQGEPVCLVRSHGSDCWEEMSGESLEMCQAQPGEYEVRKLYAEQPAPVAVVMPDPWQPIETAPKDGTEIILRKGDRVTSGAWIEWTKSEAEFHSTGAYLGNYEYDSGASWSSWDGGFCEDDEPTHWQPLPALTPKQ
ncbi:phage protein [Pseudomonas sp. CHM02]|uniref:phage protein n=1 Tax=Pseudomonas sp. CHM02 TaxID=1463662 RepID=UPI000471BC4C|nr:phage protein [Pseudomonas sp. CHM02]